MSQHQKIPPIEFQQKHLIQEANTSLVLLLVWLSCVSKYTIDHQYNNP